MTTPLTAARTGGRTQQGRGPAPDRHEPGRILGGASPPGRTRTARPSSASTVSTARVQSSAPAQSRTRQRKAPVRPTGGARTRQRQIATHAARASRAAAVPASTDYQKIIAAEFVLAELLIAATPMASKANPSGISPYAPRDMTKLLAVGVTYFLLEMLAIPASWGRTMAWLGGLILLAVGLNEAANVAKDIDALAGIGDAVKKVGSGVGKGLSGTT